MMYFSHVRTPDDREVEVLFDGRYCVQVPITVGHGGVEPPTDEEALAMLHAAREELPRMQAQYVAYGVNHGQVRDYSVLHLEALEKALEPFAQFDDCRMALEEVRHQLELGRLYEFAHALGPKERKRLGLNLNHFIYRNASVIDCFRSAYAGAQATGGIEHARVADAV